MKFNRFVHLHVMRYFLVLFFGLFLLACNEPPTIFHEKTYYVTDVQKADVKDFLADHQTFNQEVAFLVDFSVKSNKERFFVYDVKQDSILKRGLVTHGSCMGSTAQPDDEYSNVENSYCSSLGKYKIGHSYQGTFGLAYKLYGLDDSNNNAFARFVVLHAHSCVPDEPVNYSICMSQGCPTVSPIFLADLAEIIDNSDKDILLWLVDES